MLNSVSHYRFRFTGLLISSKVLCLQLGMAVLWISLHAGIRFSINENGCCCSVTQLCPTLCDPMGCRTQGLSISQFPEVCPSSCPLHQWCHPAISSFDILFSFCPKSFPASGTFPVSQMLASDDQITGVSASASALTTSIQGWFPLRLTSLISLLFKGLWRVFCSTSVKKHQFFGSWPFFFF